MSQRPNEARLPAPAKGDSALEAVLETLAPDFYGRNAFRRLGLPAMASIRDVTKRLDELKLAIELQNPLFSWAFAPAGLTLEQLREAGQVFKDPKARLLHEIFWFWPENYPEEGADPSLDDLAKGDSKKPVAAWQAKAATGDSAAQHNLAVYNHLVALQAEEGSELMEDEMSEPWRKALRYWDKIAGDDALWQRIAARVRKINDPQLTPLFVVQLRTALVPALARINAGLALRYAEKNRPKRSALHASLVRDLIHDPEEAMRVLESCAGPVARRIVARIEEAERELAAEAGAGLTVAQALRRECEPDLAAIESICGREADLFRETCTRVATTALDAVVAYQRATSQDGVCLPLLVYLQTWPVLPELRRRLEDTFGVIYGNAMIEPAPDNGETPEDGEPNYAKSYRVITTHVIPGLETLQLEPRPLRAYVAGISDLLRVVAAEACRDREDIAFAMHAFATMQSLPGEPEDQQLREGERVRFYQNFELQREKQLNADLQGYAVQVDARALRFQDLVTSPDDVIGLRYGALADEVDGKPVERLYISWCTPYFEVSLDESNVFSDPKEARASYDRILEALYFFLIPGMIERLVKAIREGTPAFLDDVPLTPRGMVLTVRSGLRKREKCVAYRNIEHRIESGAWIATDIEDRSLSRSFSTVEVWNAAIMSYVIEMLARA